MDATIQNNVFLKDFTTFKIGGMARFFARVASEQELRGALNFAWRNRCPMFVLGGGSNILVSDAGFPGLVIKMEIGGVNYTEKGDGVVEVVAGAGVEWDSLVAETVERGLWGLENLSLVPGTAGAAPVQNIGAYGVEAENVVAWVQAIHQETGEVKKFSRAECQFGYRQSIFKTAEGKKFVITRVAFSLKQNSTPNINYKDVTEYMAARKIITPTLKEIREAIIDIRKKKLPSLAEYGTAGSFFKNPVISQNQYNELLKKYPNMPGYGVSEIKIPAGWILDNICGLKGCRDGAAGVYQNQALVLVNFGGASASDIQALASKMSAAVFSKTGITLEREVEYI